MKTFRSAFLLLLSVFVLFSPGVKTTRAEELRLWFYLSTNFLVDENLERNLELLRRAAKAGYNGVVVTDSKFCRWDHLPQKYAGNVQRFRNECRNLGVEFHAAVCPIGYSNDLLSRDPNLAEGFPVRDAPFLVKNGQLVPEQPTEPILKNGNFENFRNNNPVDWGFVDEPGSISFADTEVVSNGSRSLRMQDIGPDEPRNGRAMQKIDVKPFQYYRVSIMVKTEDFDSTAAMNIAVLAPDGRSLNHHMPRIEKTQDWKRIDTTFNSFDNTTVNLYFGTWGGRSGKVWWDDAKVEHAGFVNVLRRAGTPLKLKSEDGKITYTEGTDFEKIVDPLMGNDPYGGCYTAWHQPPTIQIPNENSRLKEGQRVLADYYHALIIYGEQVSCCMAEPKTREILRWQIEQVKKNVAPDGYFMSHDEIRQTGWDKSCVDTGKRPSEILGENVAFCVETIRKVDPGKHIGAWSDMFDPTHNAKKDGWYYLVKDKGPWFGSWEKLPPEVLVMNWNSNPAIRKESLKHFDSRKHPQMLAGYYDAEPVEETILAWMRDAAQCQGMRGVMYTTWENKFDALERFAKAAQEQWKQ